MATVEALLYTVLWASAAVATKIGLHAAPPLILVSTRFSAAGLLLLGFGVLLRRGPLPPRGDWKSLVQDGFNA